VDLSTTDEIAISPVSAHRVSIRWRHGVEWSVFELADEAIGYVDPEDVLWWLLRRNLPVERVRLALAQPYPDFDVDGEIEHATMPDREKWREQDRRRRAAAREQFKNSRAAPPSAD